MDWIKNVFSPKPNQTSPKNVTKVQVAAAAGEGSSISTTTTTNTNKRKQRHLDFSLQEEIHHLPAEPSKKLQKIFATNSFESSPAMPSKKIDALPSSMASAINSNSSSLNLMPQESSAVDEKLAKFIAMKGDAKEALSPDEVAMITALLRPNPSAATIKTLDHSIQAFHLNRSFSQRLSETSKIPAPPSADAAKKPAIVRITRRPVQYFGAGYSGRSRYQFAKSKVPANLPTAATLVKVNIAPAKKIKIDKESPGKSVQNAPITNTAQAILDALDMDEEPIMPSLLKISPFGNTKSLPNPYLVDFKPESISPEKMPLVEKRKIVKISSEQAKQKQPAGTTLKSFTVVSPAVKIAEKNSTGTNSVAPAKPIKQLSTGFEAPPKASSTSDPPKALLGSTTAVIKAVHTTFAQENNTALPPLIAPIPKKPEMAPPLIPRSFPTTFMVPDTKVAANETAAVGKEKYEKEWAFSSLARNEGLPDWMVENEQWKLALEKATKMKDSELVQFDWSAQTVDRSAPAASFNFAASGFKPAKAAGWSCSVCMVNNKAEAKECISCTSPAPGHAAAESKAPSMPSFSAPSAPATSFNFAASGFKPVKTTGWSCSVCMVKNKAEAKECISCTSPAPGHAVAESKAPLMPSFSATSAPATSFNFAASGFKPVKAAGWSCSVCMVNNKTEAKECISCTSPAS